MSRMLTMLMVLGTILIMMFALNLGVASADNPEESNDGISTARDTGAGGADKGGGGGLHGSDSSGDKNDNGADQSTAAHNPICGGHPVESD